MKSSLSPRLVTTGAVLLLAALVLAGCSGGDKGPAPTETVEPLTASAGDSLRIPSLEIDAMLTLKQVTQGVLPAPDSPYDVALYDFAAGSSGIGGTPGDGGTVVMGGRNLAVDGCLGAQPPCDGVFRRLRTIEPGAAVDVVWQSETYHYQAVAVCNVPASAFDDGLFQHGAEEQLTLLTGAGSWDERSGFSHVLIVVARPAPRTTTESCPAGTRTGRP
jgi:hypothetical protein